MGLVVEHEAASWHRLQADRLHLDNHGAIVLLAPGGAEAMLARNGIDADFRATLVQA